MLSCASDIDRGAGSNEAHISLAAQRWNVQKYFHAPIPLSSCTVDPKKEARATQAAAPSALD